MADVAGQIRTKILAWRQQRAADVSEQSKQIIVAAVSAILYDPHPGWRLPTGMTPWPSMGEGLREVQQDAIDKLPELLDEVARLSPGGRTINAFVLLHAVSAILDRICPFDKGG